MDYWFSFKKLLSIYLNPVTITLELIVLGIVLIGFASRRPRKPPGPRWAKVRAFLGDLGVFLVILGVLTLYSASINPVAHSLTLRLEGQYPPLEERDGKPVVPGGDPEAIVVLAGGHLNVEGKPVMSRLSRHGLARVAGGVDLWKSFPAARFIVTGHPDETSAMRGIAERLGVPPDRIVEESESRDTKDHPRKLAPILGGDRFLLVTSATHMPRAVALFRAAGLDPVPAPVDFLIWPDSAEYDPYRPGALIPRVFNLELTSTSLHELGGIAWSKWRGELDSRSDGESANAPEDGNP
jgi:uncharacterized SAM-binding protein YcdF (DUF218 family)